jgi:hypothetical protein
VKIGEFRQRGIAVEAMQWTGNNIRDIRDWILSVEAFKDDNSSPILQATDGVLIMTRRRGRPRRASPGDWIVRVFLAGGGSDWQTESPGQFAGKWELIPGPVQQLRDIAGRDIGADNPNLADVVRQVADLLEQDLAGPDPVPEVRLVSVT